MVVEYLFSLNSSKIWLTINENNENEPEKWYGKITTLIHDILLCKNEFFNSCFVKLPIETRFKEMG